MGTSVAPASLRAKIRGCLFGGLIGDAMGMPGENKTYQEIVATYGELRDFEGAGTDDTAIRMIVIDAIEESGGHPRVDDLAAAFLRAKETSYRLWWVPVANMFHKLDAGICTPIDAGWGNMHSSSSAMAIAPMGILNAGDPYRAAVETFELATLLHSGPSGFARDAACAMAAAVAAAFTPHASVDQILDASLACLLPMSAAAMREAIETTLGLARTSGGYAAFRKAMYERPLREIVADPRETVPVALALVLLADGDPTQGIVMAANFGRDADTIATMVGSVCGALHGVDALQRQWVEKAEAGAGAAYGRMTDAFVELLIRRRDEARAAAAQLDWLLGTEDASVESPSRG